MRQNLYAPQVRLSTCQLVGDVEQKKGAGESALEVVETTMQLAKLSGVACVAVL